jgi:hypothetical protein
MGLTTRSLLLLDSCGFVDVGRSLLREDGSVVCNCCWPSLAQSFSGPSPVGFATIFYCLRFETSFFVLWSPTTRRATVEVFHPTSTRDVHYVSQSQSHITTDCQSISRSWCRAPSGAHDLMFVNHWQLRSCFSGAPSLMRGRVCLLYMLLALASVVFLCPSPLALVTIFYSLRFETSLFVASYDSEGYGGGIRTRLHAAYSQISSQSESELLCDWLYTANLFSLALSPLRPTTRDFFPPTEPLPY